MTQIQALRRLLGLAAFLTLTGTIGCTAVSEDPSPPLGPNVEAYRDAGPRARLTRPNFSHDNSLRQAPANLIAEWDAFDSGVDLNGPARPSAFEYKAVEIDLIRDTQEVILEKLLTGENVVREAGVDPIAWTRVGPNVRGFRHAFPNVNQFAVAVRAVDASGMPEPELEYDRNYVTFLAAPDFLLGPLVDVRSEGYGSTQFGPGPGVWDVSVAADTPFTLDWVIDAGWYGNYPGETNYALDVADPEDMTPSDPDGIGGWIGWTRRSTLDAPYVFGSEEVGTIHMLYLWMRDDLPVYQTLCRIRIEVVDASRVGRVAGAAGGERLRTIGFESSDAPGVVRPAVGD
ncbi:MAG: hypothetical protein R3E97_05610 [Candidatus Eisenbacteria bacterium]